MSSNKILVHKTINNTEKLIIYKKKFNISDVPADRTDFNFKFTFKEPIKNVHNVKLLNATLKVKKEYSIDTGNLDTQNGTSNAQETSFHYYILDIKELNNTFSSNDTSLNLDSTDSNNINNLDNSFATLTLSNIYDNGGSLSDYAHYYNSYYTNKNETFFDPPLNVLKEFNIKLYPHNYDIIANRDNSAYLMLEFLIETTQKIKIYIDENISENN